MNSPENPYIPLRRKSRLLKDTYQVLPSDEPVHPIQVFNHLRDITGDFAGESIYGIIFGNPDLKRVIVMGLPGSGKSTIVRALEELLPSVGKAVVVRRFDDFRRKYFEELKAKNVRFTGLSDLPKKYLTDFSDRLTKEMMEEDPEGRLVIIEIPAIGYGGIDRGQKIVELCGNEMKESRKRKTLFINLTTQQEVYINAGLIRHIASSGLAEDDYDLKELLIERGIHTYGDPLEEDRGETSLIESIMWMASPEQIITIREEFEQYWEAAEEEFHKREAIKLKQEMPEKQKRRKLTEPVPQNPAGLEGMQLTYWGLKNVIRNVKEKDWERIYKDILITVYLRDKVYKVPPYVKRVHIEEYFFIAFNEYLPQGIVPDNRLRGNV